MFFQQLKALLKKNFILWKRSPFCSLFEIIIPLVFAAFLFLIRHLSSVTYNPETSYLYELNNYKLYSTPNAYELKDCMLDGGGYVVLYPYGDPLVTQLASYLTSTAGYTIKYMDDQAINDTIQNIDYASTSNNRICFAVTFTNTQGPNYAYNIRFNDSTPAGLYGDIPDTDNKRWQPLIVENQTNLDSYFTSGELQIQMWIDNFILRKETNNVAASIQAAAASVKVPENIDDTMPGNLTGTLNYLVAFPLLVPLLRMIGFLVREKEKKIKEGMKVMGLNGYAYYISWVIHYLAIYTIIALLWTALTGNSNSAWRYSNKGLILLWYWLFCLCLIGMAFFISAFFSRARAAVLSALVFFFILSFVEIPFQSSKSPYPSVLGKTLASLSPITAMSFSGNTILAFEAQQVGLTSQTINTYYNGYSVATAMGFLVLDFFIFLLLGLYIDQVWPSEFGVSKHPLFCLRRTPKKKRNIITVEETSRLLLTENYRTNDRIEEIDSLLKGQDEIGQSVIITKLRKVFKRKKVAVDELSLNMYQGQISVLLGHNGAGKTTTISMITGMLPPTSGIASITGMSLEDQLPEIRKVMGVCPQHDILYDDLTVREHLEMFAIFKGMNKKDIPEAVDKIISDIDLVEKKNYRSKNLSGGQKRKLSIGIAFIGGSKFIVLDEPSSGMDTSARRRLWEMLKNYKTGRIILLTTHFMDEADFLGDRIAIMGKGKLQASGRPLFLKNRFGVGYNLTLVKQNTQFSSQAIKDFVYRFIPKAKVVSDVSAELTIQLPLSTAANFRPLFDGLDSMKSELNITNYGVSVTTLEEVFLKIADLDITQKSAEEIDALLNKENQQQETLEPNTQSPNVKEQTNTGVDFELSKGRITSQFQLFFVHFAALVTKRYHYFKRDRRGLAYQILLPIVISLLGVNLMSINFVTEPVSLTLTPTIYSDQITIMRNQILDDGQPVPTQLYSAYGSQFSISLSSTTSISGFDSDLYNTRNSVNPSRYYGLYVDAVDTTAQSYSYSVLVNTTYQEAAPFSVNMMNTEILRYATGNSNLNIQTTFLPLPLSNGVKSLQSVYSGLIAELIFSIGMSFIPATIIAFIVKEREQQVKHQQMVSGVSLFAYWVANYSINIVEHLIPAIVSCLFVKWFNVSAWLADDCYGVVWSLFILFGFAVIPFSYLLSFLFKDYGSAQTAAYFINFLSGFILSLFISVLRLIKSSEGIARVLQYFCRFLPGFAFSYGLSNLSNRGLYAVVDGYFFEKKGWDSDISLMDVVYLAFLSVFYFTMVFVVEKVRTVACFTRLFTREHLVKSAPQDIDDDVIEEQERVLSAKEGELPLRVEGLRKIFRITRNESKIAVDNVSFGLQNGECFGLLGVNGAGKTTTFKMLSGDIVPTTGKAMIMGCEVPKNIGEARKYIGYCPQFDALLENLTAKEHLYLYAALKGIPSERRKGLVEQKLTEMGLKKYENIPAGTYSGGNKRKLSFAIATIGNPPLVFLDEPSTGMDPEARRFMWNVISRISSERKQSTIVLTTHSMEEAEALCTRISIMVGGNIKCIGSIQHIKSKFGGGFELEIKLNFPNAEVVASNMQLVGGQRETQLHSKSDISEIIKKLEAAELIDEISEKGSGSALFTEFISTGKVLLSRVVEYVLIEKKGKRLRECLEKHFGEIHLIEHFQTFFRYNMKNTTIGVGSLFGVIEDNKMDLDILQYAIKQSSLEQIFNMFAAGQIKIREIQGNNIAIKIDGSPTIKIDEFPTKFTKIDPLKIQNNKESPKAHETVDIGRSPDQNLEPYQTNVASNH